MGVIFGDDQICPRTAQNCAVLRPFVLNLSDTPHGKTPRKTAKHGASLWRHPTPHALNFSTVCETHANILGCLPELACRESPPEA